MGTMIRRIAILAALAALVAPGAARADTAWYAPGPDYREGPAGGSEDATMVERNTETGEIRVLQFQFTAVSGNLGCTGQGPYAFFDVVHEAVEPMTAVTAEYAPALVSPYSFMKLSLLEGDATADPEADHPYIATINARGINDFLPGDGTLTLELDEPVTGVVTARFGIEVTSNCPAADGGIATFTQVGFVGE